MSHLVGGNKGFKGSLIRNFSSFFFIFPLRDGRGNIQLLLSNEVWV